MRVISKTNLCSASDLVRFVGCAHATSLDLMRLGLDAVAHDAASDDAALLQKQAGAHTDAYLQRVRSAGKTLSKLQRGDLTMDARATKSVLAQGSEVIVNAALLSGHWGGWADFLERVERPSDLGPFSYEVVIAKLKRRPHPKHVLQLVLYSDLLARVQGAAPEFAHIELGDGTRATLRLSDYAAYARLTRERFEAFADVPQPTRPVPCSDCSLCQWADHCDGVWTATDSLFKVANISRGQVKKLEAAGVATMAELAALHHPVRGLADNTRLRLITQARLQHARKTADPAFELRPPEAGKGFDLLPEPRMGDLFYDIEGDPHYAKRLNRCGWSIRSVR